MNQSEYERVRRQQNADKLMKNLVGEMTYAVIFIIAIIAVVLVNKKSDLEQDDLARKWLAVTLGYYIGEFILQMCQYHFLKKNMRENLLVMGLRFLGMLFLFGWLIYGNVIYYKKMQPENTNNSFRWMIFFLLVFGYFEMLKCCCVGTIVCIMIPFIIIAFRRARRPNWIPAPPRFVENLVKNKFNPEENKAFD